MSGSGVQLLALTGAFWTALALYRGDRMLRLAAGLALGAALAHLGWALLYLPQVLAHPWALLYPFTGFCVLFVPLGLLVCAPHADAFRVLPAALVVARLGCLAAGCCPGTPSALPWALSGLHPTPLYEVAGLLGLHAAARRLPAPWVIPFVLGGFGLLRLGLDPLRAVPPLGAPALPAAGIAGLWVVSALALGFGRVARPAPASA